MPHDIGSLANQIHAELVRLGGMYVAAHPRSGLYVMVSLKGTDQKEHKDRRAKLMDGDMAQRYLDYLKSAQPGSDHGYELFQAGLPPKLRPATLPPVTPEPDHARHAGVAAVGIVQRAFIEAYNLDPRKFDSAQDAWQQSRACAEAEQLRSRLGDSNGQ